MALDAEMDIIPVVISQYDFFNPSKKTFDRGVATIKILRPIKTGVSQIPFAVSLSQAGIRNHRFFLPLQGYSKDTMDDLIEETRERMTKALRDISKSELKKSK